MGSHLEQDKETRLKDLILLHHSQKKETHHDYPEINSDAQLRSVYSTLAQHEAVVVNDVSASTQSLLKREDIFKYLSEIDHDKEVKSMSELFSTLNDRKGEVLTTILEHIQISFIALLIAILIAVPLGLL